MRRSDVLAIALGLIALGIVAALTCCVVVGNASEKQPAPKVNISEIGRRTTQEWSEIGIAMAERDGRVAREQEEQRLQELSERAKKDAQTEDANDDNSGINSERNDDSYDNGAAWNPYYGGPRFVSREFVRQLAVQYSYCGWDPDKMVRIVFEQETHSGDTMADNGDGCYGLLQCNSDYLSREDLWNPYTNFEVGAMKFTGAGGYGPWGW